MSQLPRVLNALKLANARAPEVEALYSILKKRACKRKREGAEPGNPDFSVPRNQRRRTTSYLNRKANLWKTRKRDSSRRANRSETKTVGGSGAPLETKRVKKLCRRARRRIELKGGRNGGFGISRDGTRRLVTHVWHAKRFTMVKRWGYYIALGIRGGGRGSRAVLRWAKSSALLHDASYYGTVQLQGPQDSILKVLSMLLEPSPSSIASMSEMSRAELYGVRYGTAMLHRVGECPYGLIAPITYLWSPSFSSTSAATVTTEMDRCAFSDKEKEQSNQMRCLWIWVHAAAFDDAFDALHSACQRQNEEGGTQLKCFPRRGELGRVDILGSRALQLLQKILHPLSRSHDLAESFKLEDSLGLQQPSTSQISQVSEAYLLADADKLPVNAVLAMEVCDPREAPAKQGKFFQQVDSAIQDNQNVLAKSHEIELKVTNLPPDMQSLGENGSEETASLLEDRFSIAAAKEEFQKPVQEDFCSYWVNLISQCNTSATVMGNKALWDSQSKGLSVDPPMSENALSMERHQRRLAFFHLDGGTGNAEVERNQKGFRRSCPIVLLKHDNQKPSASGWSIILPISWVRVFWIPLVLAGAHAIGLRERRWLSSDAGLPSFPFDFPDCKAYECYMNEEAAAYEEMIVRRPPLKRPPPILLPTPWSCIQRSVKIECTERLDLVGSIAGVEVEKSGSENMHNIDLVNSACRESEISEMMTNAGIHGPDSLSVKHMYSCFPGFIARTSAALKQHLKRSGGLHLLLFPEIDQKGKKNFFHLMDEGRLGWSLKGINNLNIERDPCFLRVLLYAPRKGAFEEGAVVCAPMQNDFAAWLSRSQRWQGLEIPSTLRNADCIQQQMSSGDMMESADIASMLGQENLRKPIGFVTTGVCRGSVPAMAVAICEGTILGRLRAEQWRENKWKRKCEIFVLVRNMRSTVYRPALAGIVIEELQDVIFS